MTHVDAYILIGGRSSRFGSDKAFVEIEGEPLARRMARIVNEGMASDRLIFVAAAGDQFAPAQVQSLRHSVIFDQKPGFGAWSGLHTALANCDGDWIFVVACDLPFISAIFLQFLSALAKENLDAIVPRQPDGRLQPLCAYYRRDPTLASVEKSLCSDDAIPPLNTLFRELKTKVVESDEYSALMNSHKFFLNVNTATDISASSGPPW